MSSSKLRVGLALLLSLVLLLAACGGDDEESTGGGDGGDGGEASGEPLIIGAAIAEQGWLSAYDLPNKVSLELAVEDVNADGGILGRPLEVVYSDTKSEPDQVANAALEVIEQGAEIGVVSCDFDLGAPAAIEFQNQGMVSFSVCASSVVFGPKGIGPLAFSGGDSAAGYAAAISEWGYNEQGWESAYILEDQVLDYTHEMCDSFKRSWEGLGGTIAGEDTFQQGDESVDAQINRIKDLPEQPDAIRLCSVVPGLGSVVRQIRAAGIDSPILAGSEADGVYWHEAVPNLKDFFYTAKGSIFGDDEDPAINEFFARIEEETGEPAADSVALGGYGLIESLKIAAENAGTVEGTAVAAELEKFSGEEILPGPTTFTSEFHVALCRPAVIMEASAPEEVSFVTRYQQETIPLPEGAGGGDYICSEEA